MTREYPKSERCPHGFPPDQCPSGHKGQCLPMPPYRILAAGTADECINQLRKTGFIQPINDYGLSKEMKRMEELTNKPPAKCYKCGNRDVVGYVGSTTNPPIAWFCRRHATLEWSLNELKWSLRAAGHTILDTYADLWRDFCTWLRWVRK
jgi:hypothetical protein